jgi:predicted MFS family arabinose efflux permease
VIRRSRLWLHPDFLRLWTGQAVSQVGSQITREGLTYTALLTLNASAHQMGILNGAEAASILVLGLFTGVWADRVRRRPLMIAADLARALVLGSIPLAAVLHRLTLAHLYAAGAVTAILTVLFDVSYQAYLPSLIGRGSLVEGNSKLALTQSAAEVVGPSLTGLLVQWITAPLAILVDALSFLVSAASVWLIRKPEPPPSPVLQPCLLREIVEGFETCRRDPILRALAARTATASFFLGFGSLYVLFANRELHIAPLLLGIIITAGGAGNLFGAFAAERVISRFGAGPALIGSALATGVASLLPPLARGPVAACAAVLVVGQLFDMAWPIYTVGNTSVRQAIAPDARLGRVNSAMQVLYRGGLGLGALFSGYLAESIGVRATMLAGAAGFLLSTLWLVFSPVRHLR